ncbi:Bcr/CflA family efflux MFS transporter [Nocardioides pocheonensis]|uniref:Bcr/CflA family efflux MFS transporter n=2 Tax=Nocardioides pocheonensis TaxID=661485 RepID=A0A3N0GII6_9ACTN|nr:Bcr/CflA family efflux MFS transporter [Nocardioides pocheonensis]
MAILLAALTICAPISMDLYLPALPALTRDLGTTTSAAQLTITACLTGLALGQVITGPLSDRFGRRRPLLVGLAAFVLASGACALSPSIETLILARLGQGFAAATGIVIAQASGRDLYSGQRLLEYYSRLAVLGGLAAIVGPVLGSHVARLTGWRGMFLLLCLVGSVLLAASARVARETLPLSSRTGPGLHVLLGRFHGMARDGLFIGAVITMGGIQAASFAYLAGGTFILQEIYGLSAQGYALIFAITATGYMSFGSLSARLSVRWSEMAVLALGLTLAGLAAAGLILAAFAHLPLLCMTVPMFALLSGVGLTVPPTTSLAMGGYPHLAGTAASVLQAARFGFGASLVPLVGIAGPEDARPFAIIVASGVGTASLAYIALMRPRFSNSIEQVESARA